MTLERKLCLFLILLPACAHGLPAHEPSGGPADPEAPEAPHDPGHNVLEGPAPAEPEAESAPETGHDMHQHHKPKAAEERQ